MFSPVVRKYFLTFNFFNLPFSILVGALIGWIWGVLAFASLGLLVGYFGYETFRKNEYHLFYNLGYTKSQLVKKVCLLNISFSAVLFLIYFRVV